MYINYPSMCAVVWTVENNIEVLHYCCLECGCFVISYQVIRIQHPGCWGLQFHNTWVELNETKVTHTWIHGELDDFICFRIEFHLLLLSHSSTGISDWCVLYESLFRSLAIFERNLLLPSFIPCWWRWHVPLKCQCLSKQKMTIGSMHAVKLWTPVLEHAVSHQNYNCLMLL
jgi:hypothetical protein